MEGCSDTLNFTYTCQFVVGVLKLIKFPSNSSSFVVDLYVMFWCLEILFILAVLFTVF